MDHVKALLWLKWRLIVRGYQRSKVRYIGLVLVLLFALGPASLGGALTAYLGFAHLDTERAVELLFIVLLALWVFWLVFPLVGFSLNETYDVSRLMAYPIRRVHVVIGGIAGCLLDPTTIFVIPIFIVVLLSFSTSGPAAVLIAAALLLLGAQTLALSQALLTFLIGVLSNRRFRDVAIVAVPLVFLLLFMGPNMLLSMSPHAERAASLLDARLSRYICWTPPGLAASAIVSASQGRALDYVGWLSGSAVTAALSVALSAWAVGRVYAGAGHTEGGTVRHRQRRAPLPAWLQGLLLTPLAALALKELRYFRREPRLKLIVVSGLLPVLCVLGPICFFPESPLRGRPVWAVLGAGTLAVLSANHLLFNIFGFDREGLRLLFLLPCRRGTILLGKNLPAIAVNWLAVVLASLVVGLITHAAAYALAFAPFFLAMVLIVASAGNLVSIYFPVRVSRGRESPFGQSAEAGCLTGAVRLGSVFASMVACAPVLAGAVLPLALQRPIWLAPAALAALLYGGGVYLGLLRVAIAGLEEREPAIVESTLAGDVA